MFFRSCEQQGLEATKGLEATNISTVILKNGSEVEHCFVNLVMRALKELSDINYGALLEFVSKCRHASGAIISHAVVEDLGLIDRMGYVNPDTQNIVLSACMSMSVEDSMVLSDPIANSFSMKPNL